MENVLLGISVKVKEFKGDEETENWPFRELVGSLVWLAISTRPEKFHFSSGCYEVLFRAESHPLEEALGILGYIINGTSGLGITITFQKGKIILVGIYLEIFADADYASKATDRRRMCLAEHLCGEGEVIVGFPGRRNVLHFLTSEAEYVALHDAVKKLLF